MAEAQARMSYSEFLDWVWYRNRWGSLHPGMRIDRAIARPAAFFGSAYVKKGKQLSPQDFSPHDQDTQPEAEGSIEDAFALLSSAAKDK